MLFKLLSQHYIDDQLLEEGTLVGDGQSVSFKFPNGKWRVPSHQMEPLDPEAIAAVAALAPLPSMDAALASLPLEPAGVDNASVVKNVIKTGGK